MQSFGSAQIRPLHLLTLLSAVLLMATAGRLAAQQHGDAQEGRSDLALQYLRKALEEGYKERKKLPEDPAFASMRDLPEFKELIALEPRVL